MTPYEAHNLLANAPTADLVGSVVETTGTLATVADLPAPVGATVEIARDRGAPIEGEVVGFRDRLTMVSPHGSLTGVSRGRPVRVVRGGRSVLVGPSLLGRVIDAHGRAIDGRPRPASKARVLIDQAPPQPLDRPRIEESLSTGVRAIDGLLTCGRGQRLGVFSSAGVGKSTLLGMMARYTSADVTVVCLTGERGREVADFIERDLGNEGLTRSVLVVATSDEPPLKRIQAVSTATAVAEYFRDQGKNVLLLVDSMTRVAQASRELGLAAGEPPTTRGYPPSTYSLLPRLVERTGRTSKGSITAFYSVLVEGDDPNEPVADAMRGLLDGHLWLSRKIATRGLYPAVDLGESISRLMTTLTSLEQQEAAATIRRLVVSLEENEDLLSIGAYRQGTNVTVDAAIALREKIEAYLKQNIDEQADPEESVSSLVALANEASQWINRDANKQSPTGLQNPIQANPRAAG